jgi:chitosanase
MGMRRLIAGAIIVGSLLVGIGTAIVLASGGGADDVPVSTTDHTRTAEEEATGAGAATACGVSADDWYCASSPVSRGQMAAFLTRTLDLSDVGTVDRFVDDAGSIFEPAINKVAAAGIAEGCNPPSNDSFCPGSVVTRGELADVLARAYSLPDPGGNRFVDDDASPFQGAIDALVATGIADACNPPANDRFCPNDLVRHDEMALLVAKAEGLPAIIVLEPEAEFPEPSWQERVDVLISVFENSTTEIQYGYVEELGDGRGITAGRAGFTSGTGDLLRVVRDYVAARPATALSAYLPRLEELARTRSEATTGLEGFAEGWVAAAEDPLLRDIQDRVTRELYFDPSQAIADEIGAEFPLTRGALYGAGIQHGIGDDPDGLPALVSETNASMGGTPADGVDEREWLETFLWTRRWHLENASDPATREAWRASVVRVDTWLDLLARDLVSLDRSFVVVVYGGEYAIS